MLLAGALCLSLCACADQPVTPSVQPSPEATPVIQTQPEKTLSLAYDPMADMHPVFTESPVNRMLITLVYESLFALDENFASQPVLAEMAECDQSGKVWTVTIKEGIVFSDGTPLEVSYVVDSLNGARSSAVYAERLKDVVSVREKDGKVVITLSVPNGNLPVLLDIPIVLECEGEPAPLGTGRYRYAQDGEDLYLLTNYNRESDLPYESIPLCPAVGTSGRISVFDSGGSSVTLTDFTSPYALGYSCDYERWDYATTDLLYVGFRYGDSPCADPLVRQAFARTFDRSLIVDGALNGYGDVTTLPVPVGHGDWDEETAALLEYDLAEAEKLLSQAGYQKKEDGLLYRERTPLTVTLAVNSDNPVKLVTASLIADGLTRLGVTVTVNRLLWQDYLTALSKGTFDLYLGEVRMTGDFDVTELLIGSLNYGGCDPAVLETLIAARKAGSGNARAMASRNLWNIFALEVPVAPLCFMRESMLVRWDARVAPTPMYCDPFYNLENW